MEFFKNLFRSTKENISFIGVSYIDADAWNSGKCPNCKASASLRVDEYEKIPIAICEKCHKEFQLKIW